MRIPRPSSPSLAGSAVIGCDTETGGTGGADARGVEYHDVGLHPGSQHAAVADDRGVALRQPCDELVRVGFLRRRFDLVARRARGAGAAEGEVLLDEHVGLERRQPVLGLGELLIGHVVRVDGADGARFLSWLAGAVQEPFLMDLEG